MSLSESKVGATLAVSDLQRARSFYEEKLGLTVQVDMGGDGGEGAVVYGAGGDTTVFVYTSQYAGTNQATSVTWPVGAACRELVKTLAARGVVFERYDMPGLTVEGDLHVAGDVVLAWFKDPDGNIHHLYGG